jgi:hypothetical protein
MLKLYHRGASPPRYWQAWADGEFVTIHRGIVGERGESERHKIELNHSAETVINEAAALARAEGFTELDKTELHEVVVQFIMEDQDLAELESEEDKLEFIQSLKNQCNQCLGWSGNGRCDGGDLGRTSLNLFCQVVVASLAVSALAEYWERMGSSDEFLIGQREGDKMEVIYPDDMLGDPWYW